jgi:hypothetical protein
MRASVLAYRTACKQFIVCRMISLPGSPYIMRPSHLERKRGPALAVGAALVILLKVRTAAVMVKRLVLSIYLVLQLISYDNVGD